MSLPNLERSFRHENLKALAVILVGTLCFLWGADAGVDPVAGQGKLATLQKVRTFSNSTYARVVLDMDRKVKYQVRRLKEDRKSKLPPRIFIDLVDTHLAGDLPKRLELSLGPVCSIRAANHSINTGRLVLDLRRVERYKVFYLEKPDRIVMDLWWGGQDTPSKGKGLVAKKGAKRKSSLPLIVLDPGHGGNDPGAVGKRGVKEKDVVFAIARRLKRILERDQEARVVLTRNSDVYVDLDERTSVANSRNADLFVSIHVNAHPSKKISGLETYYLDNNTDKAALRLAVLENRTAKNKRSDLHGILQDLRLGSNMKESYILAHTVQNSMVKKLRRGYGGVRDLGAKGNLFYVLVDAHMPAILVEVSFLSNPTEEKRLMTNSYLEAVARGIADGIESYLVQQDTSSLVAGDHRKSPRMGMTPLGMLTK